MGVCERRRDKATGQKKGIRLAPIGLILSASILAFSSCGEVSINNRSAANLAKDSDAKTEPNTPDPLPPHQPVTLVPTPSEADDCRGVVALRLDFEGSGGFLAVGSRMAIPLYGLQANGHQDTLSFVTLTLDITKTAKLEGARVLIGVAPGSAKLTAKACGLSQSASLVVTDGPTPIEADRCKAWAESMTQTLATKASCFTIPSANTALANCSSQKTAYDTAMTSFGACLQAKSDSCQEASDAVDRASKAWLSCLDSTDSGCGNVVSRIRQQCLDYSVSLCPKVTPVPSGCAS